MRRLGPGTKFGELEILSVLGTGGMGTVYAARDGVGRTVALKVLNPGKVAGLASKRLVREAEAAARVSHSNVTRVHAAGELEGSPFIVYELVSGGSLAKRLGDGPLPWREAVAYATDAARGLAALHAAGVIHRDVKPENLLLDDEERVKVSDLGLVRFVDGGRMSGELTHSGEMLGTAAYMAPEQASGKGEVDARADVYGLGATLYALLTGEAPFQGSTMEIIVSVLTHEPKPPRSLAPLVPARLDALVLSCLEKEPAKRPASAAALVGELEAIAREARSEPRPRPRRWRRGAGLVGAGAGALAVWLAVGSRAPAPPRVGSSPAPLDRRSSPSPTTSSAGSTRPTPGANAGAPERLLEGVRRALHDDKLDLALERAKEAVASLPANAPATALLAQVFLERGERDAAFFEASRALQYDHDEPAAWAVRAGADASGNLWPLALEDADEALRRDDRNALAWAVRGEAKFFLEKSDEARAAGALEGATRARKLDPTLGRAWSAEALARLASGPGDLVLARAAAHEAVTRDRTSPWGFFVLAEGIAEGGKAGLAEACELFGRALERDPHNPFVLSRRALARCRRGDLLQARTDADASLELNKLDGFAWYARARIELASSEIDAALGDAERATVLDERSAGAWFVLAEAERRRGDRAEKAERDAAAGLARDEKSAELHLCAARLAAARGDRAIALLHFDRYFDLAPDDDADYKTALDEASTARHAGERR